MGVLLAMVIGGSHKRLVMMTSSNWSIVRDTDPLCGNSLVTGEIPSQRLVTRSSDAFFDLGRNKRLNSMDAYWCHAVQKSAQTNSSGRLIYI